jgi:hypothetical protein
LLRQIEIIPHLYCGAESGIEEISMGNHTIDEKEQLTHRIRLSVDPPFVYEVSLVWFTVSADSHSACYRLETGSTMGFSSLPALEFPLLRGRYTKEGFYYLYQYISPSCVPIPKVV